MAKVMAEGAEELKMGRLNLFIQTPMMVIKNEKQSVISVSKNCKRNSRLNTYYIGMQFICLGFIFKLNELEKFVTYQRFFLTKSWCQQNNTMVHLIECLTKIVLDALY